MKANTNPGELNWDSLAARLRGRLIRPGESDYDEARAIWNARIDRRPAAIVRCADAQDVITAVNFARKWGLLLSVRGGGHDYAGYSVCDGGVVADLSPMKAVSVDPDAKIVRVEAGATWNAVDRQTQTYGLATTGGTVSSVGVAGFTLGGGIGHLARPHGLAIDNLISAEVVTAQGEIVRAGESENPDLFWAIRGGGGNFGIVTSFEYRLHKVGPEVLAGQIVYPFAQAGKVLEAYRDFAADAPDEMTCYAFIINVPPLSAFPERYHGKVAIDLVFVYTGTIAEGLRLVEPLRTIGQPILDAVGSQTYAAVQQTFDAGMPKGLRWYTRAHNIEVLSDEAIAKIIEHTQQLPGPFTMVYLGPLGGAIARVDSGATAFPDRSTALYIHILSGWQDPRGDEVNIGWTRIFHDEMARYSIAEVYVNLLSEDESARVRAAYGSNYDRLSAAKRKWDPDNVLRMNQNIHS